MRRLPIAFCLLPVFAGPAMADSPFLNATCPTGIEVHADQGGPFYINGQEATAQTDSQGFKEPP